MEATLGVLQAYVADARDVLRNRACQVPLGDLHVVHVVQQTQIGMVYLIDDSERV